MEIELGEDRQPFDIDFHPSAQLVSSAHITGDLLLFRYNDDSTHQRLLEVRAHTESCRAVKFTNDGSGLITASADRSILLTDVETGGVIARLEDAHEEAINKIINLGDSKIASGDDGGVIKVWDTRQRSCCNSLTAHEDYVSDMTYESDTKRLFGTSGDGTLSVCNLRRNKIEAKSEFSEDEPLSVVIMKMDRDMGHRKIVCGTQSGALLLYSRRDYKDCSDRFVGLNQTSVGSMLKFDENRVITGTEIGMITLVNILPNKIIQPIAEHGDCPIEGLAFSHDKKYLGSIGHDSMLKIWSLDDLSQLPETVKEDDDSDMDVDTNQPNLNIESQRRQSNANPNISNSSNFFADL